MNLTLAPGLVTEAVTVSADTLIAPQADTSAAGTLIPSCKMTELSLSGQRVAVTLVKWRPEPWARRRAKHTTMLSEAYPYLPSFQATGQSK